jgi:glycine oxidase
VLSGCQIAEAWTGLRPRTPDEAPVLGATGTPGLYVAGGQFRNGILFAPLIAERVAAIILNGEPSAPFSDPKRFAPG